MNLTESQKKTFKLKRELLRRSAKDNLLDFIYYNQPDYKASWHHVYIAERIQSFWENPDSKRLMLFVPPQHGKSEIASRNFPAFVFGKNKDVKIAAASYSIDLARSFNRDIQRIIDSKTYSNVFPDTYLNSKNVASASKGSFLRNTEEFEIVGGKGSYKSVGVMGGLSGRAVDLAIIDDPVKDAMEAGSSVYRNRVWDWYLNVLQARLHNKSKVLLIMTRWHEDDLAGRLLERQPGKWDVVKIPAIKEEEAEFDPRPIGAALWPEKHSLAKLNEQKALSETVFESLYQQNPTAPDGNIIKKEWFEHCELSQVPSIVWDMWIDGAYTKNTKNDPSGIVVSGYHKASNKIYIRFAQDAFLEMPELLTLLEKVNTVQGLSHRSRAFFEPKASGKSLRQMVNSRTFMNAVEIKSPLVQEGKEARIQFAAPTVEAGGVCLVRGNWNDRFVHQICSFPNAAHDEYVDLLGYMCEYYARTEKKGVRRRN